MRRPLLLATAFALLASAAITTPFAAAATPAVSIAAPAKAERGVATGITVTLPRSVAAVDGRVLFAAGSVEVIGVATIGGGTAMMPVAFKGGASFGAYDLKATSGKVRLQLVVVPRAAGRLNVRVVIDSTASRAGKRTSAAAGANLVAGVRVGTRATVRNAPSAPAIGRPTAPPVEARELAPDGQFNARDLDVARLEWSAARERGRVCASPRGDANGDGCTDIVDVQATKARLGQTTDFVKPTVRPIKRNGRTIKGVTTTRTFVVTSTADTPDQNPGDGACADNQGRCTLRAAMTEADYLQGDERIEFDLAGEAPVTIRISSRLPIIASRAGTVVIDGYSQRGASVNTQNSGSNAVPGIELRGNGNSAREVGFRITSPGNTVRGFAMRDLWRGFVLDGSGARDNRIVGNWIGFTASGSQPGSNGQYGILLNAGASANRVGTPNLADRNVIGHYTVGIDLYGPGVNENVIQNNLFCIRPGGATARCSTAVDANFGPKRNIIGGDDAFQRNVIGPTSLQGIELSHGWNPDLPYGTDTATTYQINDNVITANWVGFRANGSYDPAYRSGLNASTADNAQGINVYDGSNDNIVQRNFVASVYDGIQIMTPNSLRNIIRGNTIGESPQGENAPLTGWGVVARWGTKHALISNNLIRNAAKGGIGLLNRNNSGGAISPAYNIRISKNIVRDTSGIGIDLFGSLGPEVNDPGDTDKGANTLLNTPEVTFADTTVVRGTAVRNGTVEVFRASRAAGANGLPVEFLGDTTVATDGTWHLNLAGMSAGDRITTLQIRPDGNTSELSTNVELSAGPGAGDPVGADDFERQVANGWGTADLGGAWNLTGNGFSVTGGEGRLTVPASTTRQARLPIATADVRVSGRVSVDTLPTGGNTWAYVLARAGTANAYRGSIRVAASGAVFLQLKKVIDQVESNLTPEVGTGIVLTPGTGLRFRMEVVGNDLRLKAWEAGTGEPDAWATTATDGSIGAATAAGLAAFTGRNVTNGPIGWSLDAFDVRLGS